MMKKFLDRMQFIRPRHLFLIFLVLAVIMISSALIELNQSKKELLDLMNRQSFTLSETIVTAARNTLSTNILVEELIEDRLLNNATVVRNMLESGNISDQILQQIAEENNIYRINIFDRNGNKIYSSQKTIHEDLPSKSEPDELLEPIFSGETDTLLLGLKEARFEAGYRYAVAISSKDRNAIVVNIDAEQLLQFRKKIGLGSLIQSTTLNPGILYTALQDTTGILAASGNINELERINSSSFLTSALEDSIFKTRINKFNEIEVYEAVHPFYFEGQTIGLFRIGLSLDSIDAINSRIYRRIIIITVILLAVGFILFTLLMVRQNYEIVQKQYQSIETYSRNVIQNVSDAIIVFRDSGNIEIFNEAAETIFEKNSSEVIGLEINNFLHNIGCPAILSGNFSMQEKECRINNRLKYLLISKNTIVNHKDKITILVFRDLTEQKKLENQIERRERMSALGQLASGVAHEIRNPLNAIGTVVQQLNRDFKPQEYQEEYDDLTKMVYQEVKRINKTIENFLRFARPEPLSTEEFSLNNFIEEIRKEYQKFLEEKGIDLKINSHHAGMVKWDRQKIRQVFVNLLENSAQAIKENGNIKIEIIEKENHFIEIRFEDDGPGIAKEVRHKIFNLYFTTKADGTGIGLSIVQRIVDEHSGVVSVESEIDRGTTFIISIPAIIE